MSSQTTKLINSLQYLTPIIKVAATTIITGAIFLELFNLGLHVFCNMTLQGWDLVFLFGRIALIAHALEAGVASVLAPSINKSAWKFGIYTFFVGTVGIMEILQAKQQLTSATDE